MKAAFGGLIVLALVVGIIWIARQARKGYKTVQTLMAQVEAHASAEAVAAAQSNVSVSVGGDGGEMADRVEYLERELRKVRAAGGARELVGERMAAHWPTEMLRTDGREPA